MNFFLTVLRPFRLLLSVCLAALLLVSSIAPALAATMRNEPNPNTNEAAKKYEQVSREPLEAGHPGPTMSEAQEKTAEGGVNEVQGRAAVENMKRPSNSGGISTVEKDIKQALEGVENKLGAN